MEKINELEAPLIQEAVKVGSANGEAWLKQKAKKGMLRLSACVNLLMKYGYEVEVTFRPPTS